MHPDDKLHWAIRLRLRLLVPRTSKWNRYVRYSTAWLELHLPG